ncbi:MAG: DNA-directed RNA polymerase [Candidatus Baldrarchaeia archaeon]
MYKLVKVEDVVRIPPNKLSEPIEDAALKVLRKELEGTIDPKLGYIIAIIDVEDIGLGRIIPGDGATYHDVVFTVLTFQPMLQEVVEGEVIEVLNFGVFVRLGPLDGLCHVSQITDDFITYDSKRSALIGRETGKVISENDRVRARIVAVSLKGGSRSGKLGLTMRQPFLGKIEWIKEEVKRIEAEKEEKKGERKSV